MSFLCLLALAKCQLFINARKESISHLPSVFDSKGVINAFYLSLHQGQKLETRPIFELRWLFDSLPIKTTNMWEELVHMGVVDLKNTACYTFQTFPEISHCR